VDGPGGLLAASSGYRENNKKDVNHQFLAATLL
jgi:hypothetical protein